MTPVWKFYQDWVFDGHPFVWCAMSSMGGNLGLFGDLEKLSSGPFDAMRVKGSAMSGVGLDPEGVDQNPAYWQLLLDTAWHKEPINVTSWLQGWAAQRCGGQSAKAERAWQILGQSVYAHAPQQTYEHHMAYCPTSLLGGGSTWDHQPSSSRPSWYSPAALHEPGACSSRPPKPASARAPMP